VARSFCVSFSVNLIKREDYLLCIFYLDHRVFTVDFAFATSGCKTYDERPESRGLPPWQRALTH
jgi:hypothetical protein